MRVSTVKGKFNCRECGSGKVRRNGYFRKENGKRFKFIQRYQCGTCSHTFSDQTFSKTYRQKRPELPEKVLEVVSLGMGIRRAAKYLKANPVTIQRKIKFLQKFCEGFHHKHMKNWTREKKPRFQFDEFWSAEGNRWQALSIPAMIEVDSYFIVAARAAYDYCLSGDPETKELFDKRVATEIQQKNMIIKRVIKKALLMKPEGRIVIETDKKTAYPPLLKAVVGEERLVHQQLDPNDEEEKKELFPINHTIACIRAEKAMLRRETWHLTKDKNWLNKHLSLYIFYYNYVRKKRYTKTRTIKLVPNSKGEMVEKVSKTFEYKTPAMHLGIFDHSIDFEFLLKDTA